MLIGFGITFFLIGAIPMLIFLSGGNDDAMLVTFSFMILAIFFIIIGWTKWNSEKEFKSLKQKANVYVHTKEKLKDLK